MNSEHPEQKKAIDVAPPVSVDVASAERSSGPPTVMYGAEANDPDGRLLDRSGVSEADRRQITALMQAMGELRDAEERLLKASLEYMQLGKTDMRALHFLIVSGNTGHVVTASTLAAHLGITSASTTKLLDRLERDGHIRRRPHPSDRRSQSITSRRRPTPPRGRRSGLSRRGASTPPPASPRRNGTWSSDS